MQIFCDKNLVDENKRITVYQFKPQENAVAKREATK